MKEEAGMNCSIKGCPGVYEAKTIVHIVKRGNDVVVFENVPAEVCDVCSDTLLAPETIRKLEALIRDKSEPDRFAPVYSFA